MNALDVDEFIAQLLASEGFTSVNEVAFVDPTEISSIEGFDEDTAEEIQTRAREHIEQREAELQKRCEELGIKDDLREVEGLSIEMLVALGENEVRNVEELAECATDDLIGWTERKDGEVTKYEGFLDGFNLRKFQAEEMIMQARVKAGWISEEDLKADEPEEEEAETAEEGEEAGAEEAEATTPLEDAEAMFSEKDDKEE
jgi:N utilization substance protein A